MTRKETLPWVLGPTELLLLGWKPTAPFGGVWLEVTHKCNLRCSHCYVENGESGSGELTTQEVATLAHDLVKANVMKITFTGGEPLMRNDTLSLISHASGLGLSTYLITNGTLVDEDVAEQLALNGIGRVYVSLDGASQEANDVIRGEGSFRLTVEGILLLSKLGISTSVNVTAMRTNLADIPSLIDQACKWGVDIRVNRFVPVGRGSANSRELSLSWGERSDLVSFLRIRREELKGRTRVGFREWCDAGRLTCAIGPTGDVKPCVFYPKLPRAPNIRRRKLENIWSRWRLLRRLRDIRSLRGSCVSCEAKLLCWGGCPAEAYARHGDPFSGYKDCGLSSNSQTEGN